MKPDINIALLNAAQEIINRFSPLIDDEYEKSRLSSWGALILISAMKFNDSGSSLKQENADILDWLLKFTNLDENDISKYGYKATSDIQSTSKVDKNHLNYNLSTLSYSFNQNYRFFTKVGHFLRNKIMKIFYLYQISSKILPNISLLQEKIKLS